MRNEIVLFINGVRLAVRGAEAFQTLSDFLRIRLRLTGTKVVCSEGDCGSCSVLLGRPRGERIDYRAVDSCIQFMFQLDGTHVVTVEGLSRCSGNGGVGRPAPSDRPAPSGLPSVELTPVQNAMVECHGSQCGYCTPGFVVSMTGLFERNATPTVDEWRSGLTGNLCRCTGYTSILAAAKQATNESPQSLGEFYPASAMIGEFEQLRGQPFTVNDGERTVFSPVDVAAALAFLKDNPHAKIVAGATDVGVQINKRVIAPKAFLDLNRIAELETICTNDGVIDCGARTSWTDVGDAVRERVPEFFDIVSIFGSPQIRHVGTIGGNIVNASPIGDSLPFLMVADVQLDIAGMNGTRTININDFYHGYRKTDLKPGEILTRVRIPVPANREHLSLYKVSRRHDLDISSFTAALWLDVAGGVISKARVALGAVGSTVIRPRRTEAFLAGKPFSEDTMRAAGDVAIDEISPISDVRGSADYRRQLTRNIFLRFLHERTRNVA
jgi:xanthine dehydrogenase small subunit